MDCSTPGFPVLHHLPEAQIHVHRVSDVTQPSCPLSSPSPPAFNLSQHQGLFQWVSSLVTVTMAIYWHVQFSSVTQSCPALCDPMDCSTPGFPVQHQLPELSQNHAIEAVMPSNHFILCRPLFLPPSILPSIRVFSSESFFSSGGQSIGLSASPSVLPMNI